MQAGRNTSDWFVANAASGSEERVASQFSDAFGEDCYCPMFRKWRKLPKHKIHILGRSRVLISTALLPGYFFLRSTVDYGAISKVHTKGFFGVLKAFDKPLFAKDGEIQALKSAEHRGVYDDLPESSAISPRTIVGMLIEMTSGPLSGERAKVVSQSKNSLRVSVRGLEITLENSKYKLAC